MDEFKEKVETLESSLYGWFFILLLASIILIAIDIPILSNLSLWGSLSTFIVQKVVRIFDICFLMVDGENIKRLILVTINLALLIVSGYILWDLLSNYDFTTLICCDLRENSINFLRRLGI